MRNIVSRGTMLACIAGLVMACVTARAGGWALVPEIKMQPSTDSTEHILPPALPSPTPNSQPSAPEETRTPLDVKIEDAIRLTLEHNEGLLVQEMSPAITHTTVWTEQSAFDPLLSGGYSVLEDRVRRDLKVQTTFTFPDTGSGAQTVPYVEPLETVAKTHTEGGNATVSEHLPTGTDVSVTTGQTWSRFRNYSTDPNLSRSTDSNVGDRNVQVTLTQPLLRGAWLRVNLASLRQAKLDTLSSEYELRGFVEDLVSQTEQTFWDCVLAEHKIAIFEDALKVAQSQADQVEVGIRVGRRAESERAAALAEVASRRSSLIDAHSNLDNFRLALLRLMNPAGGTLGATTLNLKTDPVIPDVNLIPVRDSIEWAQRMRPDLNQARLLIKRDELDVVKTKNGLLPELDAFISFSNDVTRTKYTEAFPVPTQNPRNTQNTTEVGLNLSYPIGNRAAHASHERSKLSRKRDVYALANLAQLVEQDVRSGYIEVKRAKEQITATAATRALQEETLAAENANFTVGRSNVLLVAQAQRDLLNAQINEEQAKVAYLKAIVNLYRLEGTLLMRRGVDCPGSEPVNTDDLPELKVAGNDVSANTAKH